MPTAALLARNTSFARSGGGRDVPLVPREQLLVLTCLDPRTDPAAFLGLLPGDAMVLRNAGGRVTPSVVDDVAFLAHLAEAVLGAAGDLFEVAVVHHTQCGTGFLADADFRAGLAARTGRDEQALADAAVVDPETTVRADVALLLASPQLSPRLSVSGHVYDLADGLVRTVLAPQHPLAPA